MHQWKETSQNIKLSDKISNRPLSAIQGQHVLSALHRSGDAFTCHIQFTQADFNKDIILHDWTRVYRSRPVVARGPSIPYLHPDIHNPPLQRLDAPSTSTQPKAALTLQWSTFKPLYHDQNLAYITKKLF